MDDSLKLTLVPICGLLVVLSLIVMLAFRRLIRHGDELSDETTRRIRNLAFITLTLVIISLAVISLYLVMNLRKR